MFHVDMFPLIDPVDRIILDMHDLEQPWDQDPDELEQMRDDYHEHCSEMLNELGRACNFLETVSMECTIQESIELEDQGWLFEKLLQPFSTCEVLKDLHISVADDYVDLEAEGELAGGFDPTHEMFTKSSFSTNIRSVRVRDFEYLSFSH